MSSKLPHTIGPGWSELPDERLLEISAQERLVGQIAAIAEDYTDDEFEAYANSLRQKRVGVVPSVHVHTQELPDASLETISLKP